MLLKNKLSSRRLFFGGRILIIQSNWKLYFVLLLSLSLASSFSYSFFSSPFPGFTSTPSSQSPQSISSRVPTFPPVSSPPSPSSVHKDMPLRAANTYTLLLLYFSPSHRTFIPFSLDSLCIVLTLVFLIATTTYWLCGFWMCALVSFLYYMSDIITTAFKKRPYTKRIWGALFRK